MIAASHHHCILQCTRPYAALACDDVLPGHQPADHRSLRRHKHVAQPHGPEQAVPPAEGGAFVHNVRGSLRQGGRHGGDDTCEESAQRGEEVWEALRQRGSPTGGGRRLYQSMSGERAEQRARGRQNGGAAVEAAGRLAHTTKQLPRPGGSPGCAQARNTGHGTKQRKEKKSYASKAKQSKAMQRNAKSSVCLHEGPQVQQRVEL